MITLIVQGLEYSVSSFTISDGVFGTCFFFGTGFHGLHVMVGSIIMLVVSQQLVNKSLKGNPVKTQVSDAIKLNKKLSNLGYLGSGYLFPASHVFCGTNKRFFTTTSYYLVDKSKSDDF